MGRSRMEGLTLPPLGRVLIKEHQLNSSAECLLDLRKRTRGEPAQRARYVPEADLSIGHAKTSNAALA